MLDLLKNPIVIRWLRFLRFFRSKCDFLRSIIKKYFLELEKNLGIYFDSEFPALSIGDVFGAIRALLRVERAFAIVFFSDLSTEDASPKEML